MRPTVEKFHGYVAANEAQHAVVPHAERILGAVSIWIPPIDGSHGAGIGRSECRERKDAIAIVTAPGGHRRDHSMAESRKQAFAFTAVIQRIFAEGCGQRITGCGADRCYGKVGPKSLAITLRPLFPLWRSAVGLVNPSRKRGAHDGVRTEGVKNVVAKLRLIGRPDVGLMPFGQGRARGRRQYRRTGGNLRVGYCLPLCHEWLSP